MTPRRARHHSTLPDRVEPHEGLSVHLLGTRAAALSLSRPRRLSAMLQMKLAWSDTALPAARLTRPPMWPPERPRRCRASLLVTAGRGFRSGATGRTTRPPASMCAATRSAKRQRRPVWPSECTNPLRPALLARGRTPPEHDFSAISWRWAGAKPRHSDDDAPDPGVETRGPKGASRAP
jgi:hypothetical protein